MKHVKLLLVVFILLLSVVLRFHNYSVYPQRGATSDEYSYSFLGISLWKNHVPVSWSSFPAYKDRTNLTIRGIYFPIVKPYFDHPPLYGLLVGGWALAFGQDAFPKITLEAIRAVPIILSLVSSLFVFLIAQRMYGYMIGVWALLIFTTVPIFVMNMRIVVSENLLTPLFLASIYIFLKNKKHITTKHAVTLGAFSALAFLTKILGIGVFLATLYLLISERVKSKYLTLFTVVSAIGLLSLLSYAAFYDWKLFWDIQASQSNRYIGPETILNLFRNPVIVNKIIYDGWYFLGFFALFYSFLDYKKHKEIIIPSFTYFLLLLVSLAREGSSGWYMIPLFPFMAIATAFMLYDALQKRSFGFFIGVLFVGMWQIQLLYEEPFGLTPLVFRILTALLFIPLLLSRLYDKKKTFTFIGHLLFYLCILGSSIITFNYVHPA